MSLGSADAFEDRGEALATAIQDWLRLDAAGQAPASTGIASRTWADNAAELMDILFPPRHAPTMNASPTPVASTECTIP